MGIALWFTLHHHPLFFHYYCAIIIIATCAIHTAHNASGMPLISTRESETD